MNRYALFQAAAGVLLLSAAVSLSSKLASSPEEISSVPAYELPGYAGANWSKLTPAMKTFEFQKKTGDLAYDFEKGRKLPKQGGGFYKDPFVNPAGDNVPFFVSAEDLHRFSEMKEWLSGVKSALEGMAVTGISKDCVFLAGSMGSQWAAFEKPLKLEIPANLASLLASEFPGEVSRGNLLVRLKSIDGNTAVFRIPGTDVEAACNYVPSRKDPRDVIAVEKRESD